MRRSQLRWPPHKGVWLTALVAVVAVAVSVPTFAAGQGSARAGKVGAAKKKHKKKARKHADQAQDIALIKRQAAKLRGHKGNKGNTGATGATGPSDAFSGFKNGPVTISGPTSLGKLNVPAGNYAIVAKTWATNNSGVVTLIQCVLSAGGDSDTTRAHLEASGTGADAQALSFNAVHTFSAAGTVDLTCTPFVSSVSFADIKITAIRVGNLVNGALS